MQRRENATHIEPQITPGPFAGLGMHVAAQAVGVHQARPAPAGLLWRAEREGEQRRAVITPAAERLQPAFPAVIERLADEQPAQAGELGRKPAPQRVAMPVIPGIVSERAIEDGIKVEPWRWR